MPSKEENLPVDVDLDLQNGGTIKYANEVIAIIAGVAATEVEGIAGMVTSGGIGEFIGRNRNITRGVKVELGSEEASVDLYITVEYGTPIHKVAAEVQENVRKAIETMTGLHVVKVDVHVQGVSFEKENQEQKAIESARKPALQEPEQKPKKSRAHKAKDAQKPEEDKPAAQEEKPAPKKQKTVQEEPAAPGEEPADAPQEAAAPESAAPAEAEAPAE